MTLLTVCFLTRPQLPLGLLWSVFTRRQGFRAEKRSAHPLPQAQGALFCVLTVFVGGVLSEMHEVRTVAPCKAFLFDMFAFVRRLKITLDSEQSMLKEKWIIPSV